MTQLDDSMVRFETNVEAVLALANLDRKIVSFALDAVRERDERLRNSGVDSWRMLAGNTVRHLENIRENDSLRPGFEELVNQCVVLLASYFAAGVADLFRAAIPEALLTAPTNKLLEYEIKLKVRDVQDLGDSLIAEVPDLIASSSEISFQDTKSIARAFQDYLGVEITRDDTVNEIIAGLACRHVIVHNGGIVSRKCEKQLLTVGSRKLKPKLAYREKVQFDYDEVLLLSDSMLEYTRRVIRLVHEKLEHSSWSVTADQSEVE